MKKLTKVILGSLLISSLCVPLQKIKANDDIRDLILLQVGSQVASTIIAQLIITKGPEFLAQASGFLKEAFGPKEKQLTRKNWAGKFPEPVSRLIEKIKEPESFAAHGASTPSNILFIGPPGTGKTFLARVIAGELNAACIEVLASDIITVWQGSGSANIKKIFGQARGMQKYIGRPVVLFMDEIDALTRSRQGGSSSETSQQALAELLSQMTNPKNKGIIFIGATNEVSLIDSAMKRTGRFDVHIKVDKPTKEQRTALAKHYLKKAAQDGKTYLEKKYSDLEGIKIIEPTQEQIEKIAHFISEKTDGFTASDITEVVKRIQERFAAEERRTKFTLSKPYKMKFHDCNSLYFLAGLSSLMVPEFFYRSCNVKTGLKTVAGTTAAFCITHKITQRLIIPSLEKYLSLLTLKHPIQKDADSDEINKLEIVLICDCETDENKKMIMETITELKKQIEGKESLSQDAQRFYS